MTRVSDDVRKLEDRMSFLEARIKELRGEAHHYRDESSQLRTQLVHEREKHSGRDTIEASLRRELAFWRSRGHFLEQEIPRGTLAWEASQMLARLPANRQNDDAYQAAQRHLATHVLQETLNQWGDSGEVSNSSGNLGHRERERCLHDYSRCRHCGSDRDA